MIDESFYFDNNKLWLFDYDNAEWERVRSLCLQENNWLRKNYLPDRCKISDHKVFFIYYEGDAPIAFGGLKEYDDNVARMFNRFYHFPSYRSSKNLDANMSALYHIILTKIENHFRYPLIFISMQMRKRTYSGNQLWWNVWKKYWLKYANDWKDYDGLILTTKKHHKEGFHNIVYRDSEELKFDDWNITKIGFDQYEQLFNDK